MNGDLEHRARPLLKRTGIVAAALLALGLAGSAVAAKGDYALTDLDAPSGSYSTPVGINNLGQVIGSSPAILLKNHGVFTVGPTARAAVKAAVMTEDVAATVFMALQLGTPYEIPADAVAKLHDRYLNVYGQ